MRTEDHIAQIRNLLKDAVPIPKHYAAPAIPGRQRQRSKFDSVTRDACIGRIRDLQRIYSLQWLVRQETFDRGAIDVLDDFELSALLKTLEKARECIAEGIDFHDAGLLRSAADSLDVQFESC